MLKVSEKLGFKGLAETASLYFFSPELAKAKVVYHGLKHGRKEFAKMFLQSPKYRLKLEDAVDDLKKGKFEEAEKKFKELD